MRFHEITTKTQKFYHASKYEHLQSILKSGLKLSGNPGYGSPAFGIRNTSEFRRDLTPVGGIYLTKSIADAYEIAGELNWSSPKLMCEVDISDFKVLLPDEDETERKLETMVFEVFDVDYRSADDMKLVLEDLKTSYSTVKANLEEYFKSYKEPLAEHVELLIDFAKSYAIRKLAYQQKDQSIIAKAESIYKKALEAVSNKDTVDGITRVRIPREINYTGNNKITSVITFTDQITVEYGTPSENLLSFLTQKGLTINEIL